MSIQLYQLYQGKPLYQKLKHIFREQTQREQTSTSIANVARSLRGDQSVTWIRTFGLQTLSCVCVIKLVDVIEQYIKYLYRCYKIFSTFVNLLYQETRKGRSEKHARHIHLGKHILYIQEIKGILKTNIQKQMTRSSILSFSWDSAEVLLSKRGSCLPQKHPVSIVTVQWEYVRSCAHRHHGWSCGSGLTALGIMGKIEQSDHSGFRLGGELLANYTHYANSPCEVSDCVICEMRQKSRTILVYASGFKRFMCSEFHLHRTTRTQWNILPPPPPNLLVRPS